MENTSRVSADHERDFHRLANQMTKLQQELNSWVFNVSIFISINVWLNIK